ncbi:AMP-binding protein [Sporosarcina cascadiensis]|uniref:AMP-binding protein n=1 Tax=Sporosarcina cascadiensis TaxID=2660747 RepID=UPI00129AE998|nr:AMP-binding protein [Sporosarcina cascadiensis]
MEPSAFVKYYKNEETYMSTVIDGEFYTGDIGYINKNCFFYVMDCLKDMVISGSGNGYFAELQQPIANHPVVVKVIDVVNEHSFMQSRIS